MSLPARRISCSSHYGLAMGDCKNHLCVIFQTSNNHILCGGETVRAFVWEPAKGQ